MRKKYIFVIMLIIMTISLSACGFNESGELMSDARIFIEKAEYDKAMDNLSKVLQEDESNIEARGMYYQAMKLQKADRARNRKDYEQEIKELQDLINDNQGSAKIRSKAEEKLAQAQKAFNNQRNATITRKENAKKTAEENKSKYATSSIYGRKYTQNNTNNNHKSSTTSDSLNKHATETIPGTHKDTQGSGSNSSGVNPNSENTGSGTGSGSTNGSINQ